MGGPGGIANRTAPPKKIRLRTTKEIRKGKCKTGRRTKSDETISGDRRHDPRNKISDFKYDDK